MWLFKKKQINSEEYNILLAKITRLEAEIDTLDVKLLNMQDNAKTLRAKLRRKLEEEEHEEDKTKDIYKGVLLPE